jgi:hypothetical protein
VKDFFLLLSRGEMKTIGITCNARNNKLNKHIHISNNINIFHKSYQYTPV